MPGLKSLYATLFFLSSSIAAASGDGFYLGVNAIDGNIDLQDTTVNGITYQPEGKNSYGGGFTSGYNISKHLAIDLALDGFNKIDYAGSEAPSKNYWFGYAAVKPMLPLWKFNAFLEFGAAYVEIQQNNPGSAEDTTNSEIRPFGGLGFGYNFNPNVELDLSINRIQDTTTPITFGMLTLTYHMTDSYGPSGFIED